MRILLISSSSGSRGGGELYLLYLARALRSRGHVVGLWLSTHSRMDELAAAYAEDFGDVLRASYANTYDHRLRCIATCFTGPGIRRIVRQWQTWGPEAIHFNKQNLEDGLDLLATARLLSTPTFCTIHLTQSADFLRARFARIRDWIARREIARYPGQFVAIQDQRADELRRLVDHPERVHCIFNSVAVHPRHQLAGWRLPIRNELGFRNDEFVVVAVGRLVQQKRPLLFLQIAEKIHRIKPEARFLWIGDGLMANDWDNIVKSRNLSDFVRRLPWQRSVYPYLAAADLFLHVAEYEGLPLAVLEAMSAALPVALTSNLISDIPYLNRHPDLVLEVRDEWHQVLANPSHLRNTAELGRKAVETDFSLERMGERYEALYASRSTRCQPR